MGRAATDVPAGPRYALMAKSSAAGLAPLLYEHGSAPAPLVSSHSNTTSANFVRMEGFIGPPS